MTEFHTYENYHENKSHTSVVFPYNTYLCTIPLDFSSVSLHWHNDAEIIYIKKGSGIVGVDLKNYPVHAGDIVFILPGHLHTIDALEGSRMEYENIIFEMDFLSSKLPEKMYSEYFMPLINEELDFPTLITPETSSKYADAAHFLDMADACCHDKMPAYEIAVKGYLFCFFSSLFGTCTRSAKKHRSDENLEKLKLVLTFVGEHYRENITIEQIASVCCFSQSHFMRFFKQTMGTTFVNYLNDYRLTLAATLLTTTEETILSIASDTGFDNLSYFNRQFKNKYGITPSGYRNR